MSVYSCISKQSNNQQSGVSVIIPAYNDSKNIERCLDSLIASSCQASEIIVVDDCSTDATVMKARRKGAVVIQTPRRSGPAFARNLGAHQANGEILFFIDSDVIVKKNNIELVVNSFLGHPEIAALFGSYDDEPEEWNFISQYRNLFHHYHHQHSNMQASTFWAGCGAIRKKIFEEMDGFDHKRYKEPSIEDIELGYRLSQKGYRIILEKNLQVKHLKQWKFLSMLQTDVFRRAIPWSHLIMERKIMPKDLNLQISHKISSFLVALLLLAIPFLFSEHSKIFGLFSLILFSIILILNRKLYSFYARKRGFWFMIQVIPLHFLYYLYSGLSFIYCWFLYRIPLSSVKDRYA